MGYFFVIVGFFAVIVGLVKIIIDIFRKALGKKSGIILLAGIAMFVVGMIIVPKTTDSTDKQSESSKTHSVVSQKKAKQEKESKLNSDKAKETSTKHKAKPKKLTKNQRFNATIKDRLDENKGFATGTLDENGKPTQNGTPNPAFNWAKYVNSMKVKGSDYNQVTIYVNSDFLALNDDTRTKYMASARNAALGAMLEVDGNLPDDLQTDGLFATIKHGSDAIGQSRVTRYSDFKWYR